MGQLEPPKVRGRSQSRPRYRERQLLGVEAYLQSRPIGTAGEWPLTGGLPNPDSSIASSRSTGRTARTVSAISKLT